MEREIFREDDYYSTAPEYHAISVESTYHIMNVCFVSSATPHPNIVQFIFRGELFSWARYGLSRIVIQFHVGDAVDATVMQTLKGSAIRRVMAVFAMRNADLSFAAIERHIFPMLNIHVLPNRA